MKTDSTFWSQLSAQVDSYKKRAKVNLQKYQNNRFNNLYKKKKEKTLKTSESESSPIKQGYSMNLIRDWRKAQIQKSQLIHCKLNFLQTQRNRKITTSQRIKKKLDNVLNIRSASTIQKSLCQKSIKQFKVKNYEIKRQITQKTKSQRAKIEQEKKKRMQQNALKASQVRQERNLIQQAIIQYKSADLEKKKKAVQMGQAQFQKILQKKKARQQSIVSTGRQNYYDKIRQEYINYQRVKKLNLQFMNHFKRQSKKIMDQTIKAQQDLISFQNALMLGKKNRGSKTKKYFSIHDYPSTVQSNQKNRSTGSKTQIKINNFFHLTN